MNKKNQEEIMPIVDNEGFDYAFCDYSSFEEIEDEKFHELRKKYIEITEELKEYIGFNEW